MSAATLNIPKTSAEDIIDSLKEGAELYTQITEAFVKEFVFYEKTLYEWATDLMIELPNNNDLTIRDFRVLLLELSANLQVASNYHSVACSMAETIGGGNSIKKNDIVRLIVSNYAEKGAKRPAASVIEKMADSYLINTVSAERAAKIVKIFWRQRLDTLLDLRKVFEQIGLSLSVEMKFTSS
ncbi:hypothetical protein CMI37_08820 [Candidatus Pacearchaeota archaeon]|nr:hypothetical protein [Candidatus Pacearchaeota archaeon]